MVRLCCCCLFSPAVYSLGMKVSDQIRAGAAPAGGVGAACSLCTRVTGTSQTLSFPLIGCVEAGEMDSCKSNYSHWVEPQTVDFYTADLCLIMLSDHNLAKKKKKKKLQTTTLNTAPASAATICTSASFINYRHSSLNIHVFRSYQNLACF